MATGQQRCVPATLVLQKAVPTFEIHHARLPNVVSTQIVKDPRVLEAQYGPMSKHENEEARSRYLSGVGSPGYFGNQFVIGKSLLLTSRQFFNQTVALFSGHLFNTPEALLDGRLTTKDRIEYQFKTYGGITVVFIEVKPVIGSLAEHLNYDIAECGGIATNALDLLYTD
jgi:hypothetical protein